MATPQLAKKSKYGSRPGYGGWEILDWIVDKATKYAPILKTGVAALSTYASWKDQQKKNEMQQGAYDDFMAQAEAAGHEARAAIDINLTPMTVSNVPTTKADVTDFTPVAHGGLMTLPNRQRKRYAYGPDIEDVEVMDEEILSPFDLQQETGLDLMGEQVKYNTGNPREGAWNVWNSGGIDQQLYEFDFEIFFDSGDWMDHLRGQAPLQGDMQMASHEGNDAFLENRYQELLELGLSPAEAGAQAEKDLSSGNFQGPMATGGIAGLRNGGRIGFETGTQEDFNKFLNERKEGMKHQDLDRLMEEYKHWYKKQGGPEVKEAAQGGRIGYRFGDEVVEDRETMAQSITLPDGGEEVVTDSMKETEGQTADYKYRLLFLLLQQFLLLHTQVFPHEPCSWRIFLL